MLVSWLIIELFTFFTIAFTGFYTYNIVTCIYYIVTTKSYRVYWKTSMEAGIYLEDVLLLDKNTFYFPFHWIMVKAMNKSKSVFI